MKNRKKIESKNSTQLALKSKELFALMDRCEVLQSELKNIIKEQEKKWR